MKLTTARLKKLIREEIEKLQEAVPYNTVKQRSFNIEFNGFSHPVFALTFNEAKDLAERGDFKEKQEIKSSYEGLYKIKYESDLANEIVNLKQDELIDIINDNPDKDVVQYKDFFGEMKDFDAAQYRNSTTAKQVNILNKEISQSYKVTIFAARPVDPKQAKMLFRKWRDNLELDPVNTSNKRYYASKK